MDIEILHTIQPLCVNKDFARVIVSPREISHIGLVAQSYIHFRHGRKQNLNYVRKAQRRLQRWCRSMVRAELRPEQRIYFGELHRQQSYAPSTNEIDEDDFDYGAFIDHPT